MVLLSDDRGSRFRDLDLPTPPSQTCAEAAINPTVHVAASGAVGVVFVCQSDTALQAQREVWFSVYDRAWSRPMLLASQAAPDTNASPQRFAFNPYWALSRSSDGEYWGLTSTAQGFTPMWIDTRSGLPQLWAQLVVAS